MKLPFAFGNQHPASKMETSSMTLGKVMNQKGNKIIILEREGDILKKYMILFASKMGKIKK